jgi:methionyl aminopeptidase
VRELIPRKSTLDLVRITRGSRLLFPVFREIGSRTWADRPAVEIDRLVGRYLRRHGMVSAMAGYRGYPAGCSVSPNAVAVHGVPAERRIVRGDLFTVDVAARSGGWVTDAAWTYLMPGCSTAAGTFYRTSWRAFRELLTCLEAGMSLYDLALVSQEIADRAGLTVVPDFVGHGIGRELHEPPVIPFALQQAESGAATVTLRDGMTINVEPVYSSGTKTVEPGDDGWGFRTTDGSLTAHFELTVLLTNDGVSVLQFDGCSPRELPAEPPFGLLTG